MQCQNAAAIDTSHCRAVRRSWASIYDVHSELGPQEADEKKQNQRICDSDKGGDREGVKKSGNFADVIHGSPIRWHGPHRKKGR